MPELASKTTYLWVGWYVGNLAASKPLFDVCFLHHLPFLLFMHLPPLPADDYFAIACFWQVNLAAA